MVELISPTPNTRCCA